MVNYEENTMIRQRTSQLIWGVIFSGLITSASADILLIEKVRERMARDLPDNGLRMTEVEQQYGQPQGKMAAVGDPPITRWEYAEYTVFFEYDVVIESVLHHDAVVGTP